MNKPKEIDQEVWDEFTKYLSEKDRYPLEVEIPVLWDAWYDGYCAGRPLGFDVTELGMAGSKMFSEEYKRHCLEDCD